MLVELITDFWMDGSVSARLASGLASQLGARQHAELTKDCVTSFNAGFLKLEAEYKLLNKTGWEAIIRRNLWFQDVAKARLKTLLDSDAANVVFSYSYAAKQFFELARSAGNKCVLGQIDPGLYEWQMVDRIRRKHSFEPIDMPPRQYWDDWHSECELADIIVVNSAWSKQALLEQGICENKIRIVPLAYESPSAGNDFDRSYPERFSDGRPLEILFLGQVIPRKGIIELIGAINSLQPLPIRWTVVGDGEKALLGKLKQISNVKTVGHIDRSDVASFYEKADVFILPTHSDGFAITLVEAAAHGLPIIASPFCGNVVHDGINGIELSEVSVPAIAESVRRLIEDPGLLARLASAQHRRTSRTVDDVAEELTSLFKTEEDNAG